MASSWAQLAVAKIKQTKVELAHTIVTPEKDRVFWLQKDVY